MLPAGWDCLCDEWVYVRSIVSWKCAAAGGLACSGLVSTRSVTFQARVRPFGHTSSTANVALWYQEYVLLMVAGTPVEVLRLRLRINQTP